MSIPATDVLFTPSGTGAAVRDAQTKLRDVVSVADFGAVGDGITDDRTAIQNALDACAAAGGGVVTLLPKRHYIGDPVGSATADIVIPAGVTLKGSPPGGYQSSHGYSNVPYTIVVPPTGTIRLRRNAGIDGVAVVARGLFQRGPLSSAALVMAAISGYAGIGVTLGAGTTGDSPTNGSDSFARNLLVVGFSTGIKTDRASRVHVSDCTIDCHNAINHDGSYDPSFFTGLHARSLSRV